MHIEWIRHKYWEVLTVSTLHDLLANDIITKQTLVIAY